MNEIKGLHEGSRKCSYAIGGGLMPGRVTGKGGRKSFREGKNWSHSESIKKTVPFLSTRKGKVLHCMAWDFFSRASIALNGERQWNISAAAHAYVRWGEMNGELIPLGLESLDAAAPDPAPALLSRGAAAGAGGDAGLAFYGKRSLHQEGRNFADISHKMVHRIARYYQLGQSGRALGHCRQPSFIYTRKWMGDGV